MLKKDEGQISGSWENLQASPHSSQGANFRFPFFISYDVCKYIHRHYGPDLALPRANRAKTAGEALQVEERMVKFISKKRPLAIGATAMKWAFPKLHLQKRKENLIMWKTMNLRYDRPKPSMQLANEWKNCRVYCRPSAVRKMSYEMGSRVCRPTKVLRSNIILGKKQLARAKTHKDWTTEDWEKVNLIQIFLLTTFLCFYVPAMFKCEIRKC